MKAITANQPKGYAIFQVAGDLSGRAVAELEKCWHTACEQKPKTMCVDLRSTKQIDEAGKHLLCEMFGNGVELLVPVRNKENKK